MGCTTYCKWEHGYTVNCTLTFFSVLFSVLSFHDVLQGLHLICVRRGYQYPFPYALGMNCMYSLWSLWTSTPCAREIFFTIFSSSSFCARCSQAMHSHHASQGHAHPWHTPSPSFSFRDTLSWASSCWMPVSFCWSSPFVFSSSSNWDYISQKAIWCSRFVYFS